MTKTFSGETYWHIPRQRRLAPRDKLRIKQWQEPGSIKKQCQAAHPPAYDQWNLTVYYLSIPCQPLMKGLIVSDRLWSAHRLFWNVNWRKKERAPWRVACREKRGPHPLGRLPPPRLDMCQVGLDESWENKKKMETEKKALSIPFLPPFAHSCLSDHRLPPLFCQRPSWWLLSEVRISFVVWCFAVATAEMLPSSAYAQVGVGWSRSGCWIKGVGKARMPVVSADPTHLWE